MILDQFGRPVVAPSSLKSSSIGWLARRAQDELKRSLKVSEMYAAAARADAVRESAGVDMNQTVGATIRVALPKRFLAQAEQRTDHPAAFHSWESHTSKVGDTVNSVYTEQRTGDEPL